MAIQNSDADWKDLILQISDRVQVSDDKSYSAPAPSSAAFAKTIDHTLLKLDATESQVDELCREAIAAGFATVCVRPNFVARCTKNLLDNDVRVACVIGFHEGIYDLAHKRAETALAMQGGAAELDLVINYPQLQRGEYAAVFGELAALRTQAPRPILIKLIIETSQLSREEIVAACVLAAYADMDYVKTSTGFNGPGASVENVRLMKAISELLRGEHTKTDDMLVKASGGVRSLADAVKMLEAGASRLGTSGGVKIAQEGREAGQGTGQTSPSTITHAASSIEY